MKTVKLWVEVQRRLKENTWSLEIKRRWWGWRESSPARCSCHTCHDNNSFVLRLSRQNTVRGRVRQSRLTRSAEDAAGDDVQTDGSLPHRRNAPLNAIAKNGSANEAPHLSRSHVGSFCLIVPTESSQGGNETITLLRDKICWPGCFSSSKFSGENLLSIWGRRQNQAILFCSDSRQGNSRVSLELRCC